LPHFRGTIRDSGGMKISNESIITATSAQVFSSLGEEVIILHFETGVYFGLDGVGMLVWNKIQSPCRVDEILDAVLGEYEVSSDRCMQDLTNLLQDLYQQGLVEIGDETTA
jgi:Coenzyme PQQ synthesis protein D (PqqD)